MWLRFLLCISLLTVLNVTTIAQSTGQDGAPTQTTPEAATANQQERVPLETQLPFRPKSIYIEASPDTQPIKIEILNKLRNWGEITVVNMPEQADIILQLVQSGQLNLNTGSGNRGSVVLKNRRTGEDLWSQSRGGGWSMRGFSNAAIGRKLGDDLIQFLSKYQAHIDKSR